MRILLNGYELDGHVMRAAKGCESFLALGRLGMGGTIRGTRANEPFNETFANLIDSQKKALIGSTADKTQEA